MADTQIKSDKQLRFMHKEPSKYNVIMHNDDVTTMDFVVMVLEHIFHKDPVTAEEIMMTIHTEGAAIVGTYHKDIAESKVRHTIQLARQNEFPLQLTIEEA